MLNNFEAHARRLGKQYVLLCSLNIWLVENYYAPRGSAADRERDGIDERAVPRPFTLEVACRVFAGIEPVLPVS